MTSGSQKFCKDCKWCNRSGIRRDGWVWDVSRYAEWTCGRQVVVTNPVTGCEITTFSNHQCSLERGQRESCHCGPDGRFFEPLTPVGNGTDRP